uniref:Ionotropic glutamate receptor C-terminal domain-containing protein n=1 Tax=Timema bartmani TaxID=61472 RepID=A0A7R9ESS2_9NEOP|nr:unnamed protein product [Timema bartmani]
MTEEIASRYFSNHQCVAVFGDMVYSRVKLNVPTMWVRIPLGKEDNTDHSILKALDASCEAFIIQLAEPETFIRKLLKLYKKATQRRNRKVLLLPEAASKDAQSSDNVLKMKELTFLPDLVVAKLNTSSDREVNFTIQLFTHKYVGKEDSEKPVLLDVWSQGKFLSGRNLFPDKLSNLMGKPLKYATFTYPPYAITQEEDFPPLYDGTEVRIALEFSKMCNGTSEFIVDSVNEFGEVWENDTGNGILGNVVEDRAYFGFGSLDLWLYEYQHLDLSYPYIRTAVTCLAPQPSRLPGWMTVILPFSLEMWWCLSLFTVLAIVTHYLIDRASIAILKVSTGPIEEQDLAKGASFGESTLLIVGLLLLQTPDDDIRHTGVRGPNRHMVNWLHVMFMLVTASYAGGLASVLTLPRYWPPIDTMADLAASNMPWAATHEAWAYILRGATDYVTSHVYQQFHVYKKEELRRRSTSRDLAFAIERLPAGHYAIGDFISEESVSSLRIMTEDVYWAHVTSYSRKGSPFIESYNRLIHRLIDSGLIRAWEGQVVRKFLPDRVQRAVRQSGDTVTEAEPTILEIQHVQGAYFILFFGLSASLIGFFGEIGVSHYRKKGKEHN